MAFYAFALIPLVRHLQEVCPSAGQVWYTDDDTAANKVPALLSYCQVISDVGPKYGYYLNPKKTVLPAKPNLAFRAKEAFTGTGVSVRTDGVRYLGEAVGTQGFCDNFVRERMEICAGLIQRLSTVTMTQPQAAYHLLNSSLQSRWTFLQRVIAADPQLFGPQETVIVRSLLPALTGHTLPVNPLSSVCT